MLPSSCWFFSYLPQWFRARLGRLQTRKGVLRLTKVHALVHGVPPERRRICRKIAFFWIINRASSRRHSLDVALSYAHRIESLGRAQSRRTGDWMLA